MKMFIIIIMRLGRFLLFRIYVKYIYFIYVLVKKCFEKYVCYIIYKFNVINLDQSNGAKARTSCPYVALSLYTSLLVIIIDEG